MKVSKDLSVGNLHPRENLFLAGTLGSLNAELQIPTDGVSSVMFDLRGTFSLTAQLQGTIDGVNWVIIPVRPITAGGGTYVAGVVGTVAGIWGASCVGFKAVRVIATAYTSGSATTTLMGSNAIFDETKQGRVTPLLVTVTAAAGVAATLTLPSPGAGLRHYITYLRITRFAAALLTAGATPVLVTTTNIPGAVAFSLPAEAAPQGTVFVYQEDFACPLVASAQATATTFVAPLTTGVIWRITAGYYVAP